MLDRGAACDRPVSIRTFAITVAVSAIAIHAWSIRCDVGSGMASPLHLRGAAVIESIAAISLLVFLGIRFACRDERRVASVSIFTASLILSLTAPALFLPMAAERAEWWALWGGGAVEARSAFPGFSLWALSLLLGGLAMHLWVSLRWRRASGAV